MIRVFLSWSGKRSREMASALSDWLPHVIQDVKPWFSREHIKKGQNWNDVLGKTLKRYHHGILCITPENYEAPWICFEAGALSKQLGNARVCPLLFGIQPGDIEGPVAQFQATVFTRDDMLRFARSLNDLHKDKVSDKVLTDAFNKSWNTLVKRFGEIENMELEGSSKKMQRVIKTFAKYSQKEPEIGGHVYFRDGFESHALYDVVTNLASTRLLILGRKNRKLFDKDHLVFFKKLKAKIDCGFDFRVLFLDPAGPKEIIQSEHRSASFAAELQQCCHHATDVLYAIGIDPSKHARFYRAHRSVVVVAIDDATLFSPIHLGPDGKPFPLTKAAFTIVNSTSPQGAEMCQLFEELWASGSPMT